MLFFLIIYLFTYRSSLRSVTGQLVTVSVGYETRYFVVALIDSLIPAIFFLGLIWLPESPSFLVLKGMDSFFRDPVGQSLRFEGCYCVIFWFTCEKKVMITNE